MPIKLTTLNPAWWRTGGEGVTQDGQPAPERYGEGITFDCPCGCGTQCSIPFANPLDGHPPNDAYRHAWRREGCTFEELSITPSILRIGGCGWHGFIGSNGAAPGEVITC